MVFPRLLKKPMRWLTICIASSRVRRLKNLRSIGLNKDIRKIMEEGPPDPLPAQFHKLPNEKEAQTALHADAAMAALGWTWWCWRACRVHPRQSYRRRDCVLRALSALSSKSGSFPIRRCSEPGDKAAPPCIDLHHRCGVPALVYLGLQRQPTRGPLLMPRQPPAAMLRACRLVVCGSVSLGCGHGTAEANSSTSAWGRAKWHGVHSGTAPGTLGGGTTVGFRRRSATN